MADVLPISFPIPTEGAIASYSFTDIASGTGIIRFYLGKTKNYNLISNFQFYSDPINTDGIESTTINFDVLMNRPLQVIGRAIANIPFMVYTPSGQNQNAGTVTATLQKISGGSTTTLATTTSSTISASAPSAGREYTITSLDLDISLTNFKKDDTLRLAVSGTHSGVGGTCGIGHDPYNRSSTGIGTATWSTTVPSNLILQIPVRLDL